PATARSGARSKKHSSAPSPPALGHPAEGQQRVRSRYGRRAGRLHAATRRRLSAGLPRRDLEATHCRNARADPDESGTPGPFRLRVRAQWHRQSLHDVCSARRLAPRQGHRSPYRRGLRSRLERLGRHPLRARQDHRSGPGQSQHPQQGFTLRSLSGRKGAFKMAIKKVNGRWYLYMGHLWHYGWSIVDVTDSKDPKFVKTIQGPKNTWTIQMTLHDNIMVTALEKSSLAWGADPNKPNEEGVLIWDISDPVNPRQLSHWKTGATGTHRNSYPGGKYAYLSAAVPGFSSNILVILDI